MSFKRNYANPETLKELNGAHPGLGSGALREALDKLPKHYPSAIGGLHTTIKGEALVKLSDVEAMLRATAGSWYAALAPSRQGAAKRVEG